MSYKNYKWSIGPFKKDETPVLEPDISSIFDCPIQKKEIHWEESNTYNPAAIVKDGKLHLFYRADDTALDYLDDCGYPMVTCRIGHAESSDGIKFERYSEPAVYPDEKYKEYEWNGGCQDLHIFESEDGTYYMNYTAWIGKYTHENYPTMRDYDQIQDVLMIATSKDLVHWEKHGPALSDPKWRKYLNHTRSGTIICKEKGGKLVTAKINGKYWMYMGLKGWLMSSVDLINWDLELNEDGSVKSVFPGLQKASYANGASEAGAGAILTDEGIVFFFNAIGSGFGEKVQQGVWILGQALLSKDDFTTVLDVMKEPFMIPEYEWEKVGHNPMPSTVCNTIVKWQNKWTIYYGAADHVTGRAVSEE